MRPCSPTFTPTRPLVVFASACRSGRTQVCTDPTFAVPLVRLIRRRRGDPNTGPGAEGARTICVLHGALTWHGGRDEVDERSATPWAMTRVDRGLDLTMFTAPWRCVILVITCALVGCMPRDDNGPGGRGDVDAQLVTVANIERLIADDSSF